MNHRPAVKSGQLHGILKAANWPGDLSVKRCYPGGFPVRRLIGATRIRRRVQAAIRPTVKRHLHRSFRVIAFVPNRWHRAGGERKGIVMKIEVRKLERIETTAIGNGCCGCTDC
ncbi:hypothetical protein [Rugosimonospora acidiphila]|uniref:hypothetical protein n=1 Tax=Rugosimonospora acidiphila TaxID=556531 RepID=UPI0031ED860C